MSTQANVTNGTHTYEVTVYEDGSLKVWHRGGDSLLILPEQSGNVIRIAPWPIFQPVVPPTPAVPVQVSRDLIAEVMAPRSNGVGREAVEAVQRAVEAEPAFRAMLEGIIHATLTKSASSEYGYETVEVRRP